jgi:LmbE family N-acetylglucosaminyl deacetylase
MKKVLVIAAHPDDEILGCGGTLLKHINQGDEVYVIILGEGITSRSDIVLQECKKRVGDLESVAQKVGHFMGWKKLITFKVADNRFDSADLLDIVKLIEEVKNEVDPHIVYTHHFGDLNIDHRITHEAVLTAFRPLEGASCRRILTFETPSSTEWANPAAYRNFVPTVYVDITDTIVRKCKAMGLYKSEARPYPHPRSTKALKIKAQNLGVHVGMAYAEAFSLVRELI